MEERLIMANPRTKPAFIRKQYLIKKGFQLKYVGLILALMFMTAVICSYVVYYTVMITLGEKLANVYPQGRLVSMVRTVNFRIMLSIIFITPVVAVVGIYLSHKIAGPIFRMESFLKNMASGNFASRITLRKGDELVSLADGMNSLSDAMKANVQRQKTQMSKVVVELEGLKCLAGEKPRDPEKINSAIDKLEGELRSLIAELDKYKV